MQIFISFLRIYLWSFLLKDFLLYAIYKVFSVLSGKKSSGLLAALSNFFFFHLFITRCLCLTLYLWLPGLLLCHMLSFAHWHQVSALFGHAWLSSAKCYTSSHLLILPPFPVIAQGWVVVLTRKGLIAKEALHRFPFSLSFHCRVFNWHVSAELLWFLPSVAMEKTELKK